MRAPCGVKAFRELRGGIVVGPGSGGGAVARGGASRSASFAPRMATPAFSMASSRRSRTRWVNVHSSTSESAFVGHDTMHRGPPGTFAHRSHATTDA